MGYCANDKAALIKWLARFSNETGFSHFSYNDKNQSGKLFVLHFDIIRLKIKPKSIASKSNALHQWFLMRGLAKFWWDMEIEDIMY